MSIYVCNCFYANQLLNFKFFYHHSCSYTGIYSKPIGMQTCRVWCMHPYMRTQTLANCSFTRNTSTLHGYELANYSWYKPSHLVDTTSSLDALNRYVRSSVYASGYQLVYVVLIDWFIRVSYMRVSKTIMMLYRTYYTYTYN